MKIAFLVHSLDLIGGTERSVVTQANVLADRHSVEILSLVKSAKRPHFPTSPRVGARYLVSAESDSPGLLHKRGVSGARALDLHRTRSLLVPQAWDRGFTGLTDVAIEPALRAIDVDVVVTVTPALLSLAVQFVRPGVAIVHQEHRASAQRTAGLTPLLAFAPRADLVGVLTEDTAIWLKEQLGPTAPEIAVVPNPLPAGYKPCSMLDAPLIMAAGRLAPEKQFAHLIRAFALNRDQLPGWRLRIFGDGPQRAHLERLARNLKLFDCVELPGTAPDLRGEWAKASIAALTSEVEGFPLVVQEAMAAGVPVVSYDCPSGPRELITHEHNGLLIPPDSIRAMAAGLLRVAQDVQFRRAMGRAALEFSRQFDPELIATIWERLLASAVERAAQGRAMSPVVRRLDESLRSSPISAEGTPAKDAVRLAAPSEAGLTKAISPAESRQLALRWAAGTAEQLKVPWLVIPPRSGRPAVVVVPDSHRIQYLDLLGRSEAPSLLTLHDEGGFGWPKVSGPVDEMCIYLRRGSATQLRLQARDTVGRDQNAGVYSQGCGVEIEFWHVTAHEMVAPRRNIYTSRIPLDFRTTVVEVDQVNVPTLPLMARPTVYDRVFPVDVVFTWVDGTDPAWIARREQRLAALRQEPGDITATGAARYRSRDELRFSLRSVHLFAPWVRHIFLVTDRQVPPWLDTKHPLISVVDHRDILDAASLPTFNSHAIETGLHRIEGLAEHFIYFNDDVFLGRPVGEELFFSPSGQTAMFVSPEEVGLERTDASAYLLAALNNRRLLERDFQRTITNCLLHTPHPLRSSVISEVEARYALEFEQTAAAPFRSRTDVAPLSSLVQYYSLLTGSGYVGEIASSFVPLAAPDLRARLDRALDEGDQDVFCLGDYHDYALPVSVVNHVTSAFLEAYFPVPAPWERSGAEFDR
jgi:glycosyltransferase involved in cell wall biosynthesis